MHLKKVVTLKIKAAGPEDGLEEGQFIGYASVFGNIDIYGDKVIPGAFTKTLEEWTAKKDSAVIPLLYGHDMQDPNNNVGFVLEAKEDDHGLLVKCQIDLDDIGNGRQVYKLVKGRRLAQMSFAYDIISAGAEKEDEEMFYALRELKLYEVSLVPVGANQETELVAVKAAIQNVRGFVTDLKAGRVLSAKNESALREAQAQIAEASQMLADVLSAVEATDNQETEKANDRHPAKSDEEPRGAKSDEEPSVQSSADTLLSLIEVYQKGMTP